MFEGGHEGWPQLEHRGVLGEETGGFRGLAAGAGEHEHAEEDMLIEAQDLVGGALGDGVHLAEGVGPFALAAEDQSQAAADEDGSGVAYDLLYEQGFYVLKEPAGT